MRFAPARTDTIVIIIHADENGPTQDHRDVYAELEHLWTDVLDILAEPIANEVFRYFGDAPENYRVSFSADRDVLQHLMLGYIEIDDVDPPKIGLEFIVPTKIVVNDGPCEHPLCVRLVDWRITYASFSGWPMGWSEGS